MAAAAAILLLSDGQETSAWSVSPAILLAIMSALGSALFGLAESQGATFAWWTSALRGSTLTGLHSNWEMGTSLWASLTGFFPFSSVPTAKIVVTACFAIGPLLQRATSVIAVPVTSTIPLSGIPAASLNSALNVTVSLEANAGNTANTFFSYASPELIGIIADHQARKPINVTDIKCEGTCSGKIHGLGVHRGAKT
ncbi:hypothetical protein B0T16DRAFT_457548 [Cercophora newfieldiana]|uniref:Uncharacterized protein n=1 Tax=Cercophora newfieldiana TaxID=92897 RepID=A0AA40CNW1_9PEZI|nr:hypothetical protein B0T16DRAFT_457548 [Cercophora newfieldiana]